MLRSVKNISDLLISMPFAGTNRAHLHQQFKKIILPEVAAILQPFIIHGKALDDVPLIKAGAQIKIAPPAPN